MNASFKLLALFLCLSSISWARTTYPPRRCTIKTWYGYYLTALGGGGRKTSVLQTTKTTYGNYETFWLMDTGEDDPNGTPIYGILTYNHFYLTVVGGGGRTRDVIHSDATKLLAWEKFSFYSIEENLNWVAIRTQYHYFLTAVGGGGQYGGPYIDVIHSNRVGVDNWEKFLIELLPQ